MQRTIGLIDERLKKVQRSMEYNDESVGETCAALKQLLDDRLALEGERYQLTQERLALLNMPGADLAPAEQGRG